MTQMSITHHRKVYFILNESKDTLITKPRFDRLYTPYSIQDRFCLQLYMPSSSFSKSASSVSSSSSSIFVVFLLLSFFTLNRWSLRSCISSIFCQRVLKRKTEQSETCCIRFNDDPYIRSVVSLISRSTSRSSSSFAANLSEI